MNNNRILKNYLRELKLQIEFSYICYEHYINDTSNKESKLVFMHAHHLLVHVANISKIIDSKKRKELFLSLDFSIIDLKKFRELRNHLEHFDERLDNYIKNNENKPFFDMNNLTGTKGFPFSIVNVLRAFDGNNFIFLNEKFNLEELVSEIKKIEIIIEPFVKEED